METIDTSTLAQQLGIKPQTVNARARALNLTPTTVSQPGGGRPKSVWSMEQAKQIAAAGKTQAKANKAKAKAQEFSHEQEQAGYLAVQQTQSHMMASLQGQMGQLDMQCEHIEDQFAAAQAARIAAIPARSAAKAHYLLDQHGMGLDFSGFGNIQILPHAAPAPAPSNNYLAWAKDNSGIGDGPDAA